MRKLLIAILIISSYQNVSAQQYSLFGSNTMFDAFENPAQKSFELNSSRKFSSNFFLPYFGANALNIGDSKFAIRKYTQEGIWDTRYLPIGTGKINHFYESSNVYVAAFRLFKSYKYQKEIGLSWQVRSDANLDYQNEALSIFDSYKNFTEGVEYNDIFNAKGHEQTYHQFSLTYRENYNKQLAFGVKLSLLSGMLYNKINITDSYFYADPIQNQIKARLAGTYSRNFNDFNEIGKKTFVPTFENPGLSMSFGTNYTSKKGLFLMANIKDLGFIWWRNNTQQSTIDEDKTIKNVSTNPNAEKEITDMLLLSDQYKKFLAPTNGKIDVYASKRFDFYKPALVASKNLFYKGGDVALVNEFIINNMSGSITPAYNLNNVFMVGLQAKYQTPNFEAFMGTDNIIATSYQAIGTFKKDATFGAGPNGGSFYMGVGIKFGDVVNHPQFSDMIPGINDEGEGSFFKNIFSVFKRK